MLNNYFEPKGLAIGEIVEKKSRFIAHITKVDSEDEALKFIESIKKKHYDARHNCFAFSIGVENSLLRFSDDGEPQGTAGKPILEIITGSDIKNICIVVTRYFGGTLLGTGGLTRAYKDASRTAMENLELINCQYVVPMAITTDYNGMGKLKYLLMERNIEVSDIEYGQEVVMKVNIPVDNEKEIETLIIDATNAKASVLKGKPLYIKVQC